MTTKVNNRMIEGTYTNIMDFGADPTGAIDSTQAVQDAINKGGVTYFPSGTFLINTTFNTDVNGTVCGLLVPSGAKLVGAGDTVLQSTPQTSGTYSMFHMIAASNIVIEDMLLRGERDDHLGSSGEHGMGLRIGEGCRYIRLNNIRTVDFWGDGLYIGGGVSATDKADYISVENCVFQNSRRQGCSITSAADVHFTNCVFRDTNGTAPQCGVDIEPNTVGGVGQTVERITFDGCHSFGNVGRGILLDANQNLGAGESIQEIRIRNCRMYNNQSAGLLSLGGTYNVIVSDCLIHQNASWGVSLYDSNGSNRTWTLTGNQIWNNGNFNFYVDNVVDRLVVTGNTFGGNTSTDDRHSVNIRLADDLKFSSNLVYGAPQGLKLSGVDNATIVNNTFQNLPKNAVEIADSCNNCIVNDNMFESVGYSTATTPNYWNGTAILIRAGSTKTICRGNMFTGSNPPRDGYYCFRDSNTHDNKVIYDVFNDVSVPGAIYVSNSPTVDRCEVVSIDTILTYPMP